MTKARDLANSAAAFASVSATELGYVDGVTSAIQTQMDGKIAKTLTTTTGDIIYASGANTPARLGIGSTDQVLKVTAGVPTWATPASGTTFHGCSLYSTAAISVTNYTYFACPFASENYDSDGYHSTSTNTGRITIPTGLGGKYLITAGLANTSYHAVLAYIKFKVNGVDAGMQALAGSLGWEARFYAAGAGGDWAGSSTVLNLAAGDYVEMFGLCDSTTASSLFSNWFQASYLGA